MKKSELRDMLCAGHTMDELITCTRGQDCLIFRSDCFQPGDEVLYIPDIDMNEIPMDRPLSGREEIEEVLHECYTGDQLLELCGNDRAKAERLFWYCDWQHPEAAVDELDDEE